MDLIYGPPYMPSMDVHLYKAFMDVQKQHLRIIHKLINLNIFKIRHYKNFEHYDFDFTMKIAKTQGFSLWTPMQTVHIFRIQ